MVDETLAVAVLSGVFGVAGVLVGVIASDSMARSRVKEEQAARIVDLMSRLDEDIHRWLVHIAENKDALAGILFENWGVREPQGQPDLLARVKTAIEAFPFPEPAAVLNVEETRFAGFYVAVREMLQGFIKRANASAEELRKTGSQNEVLIANFLTDAQNVATAANLIDYATELFGHTLDSIAQVYDNKVNEKQRKRLCDQFKKNLHNVYESIVQTEQIRKEWARKVEESLSEMGWKA